MRTIFLFFFNGRPTRLGQATRREDGLGVGDVVQLIVGEETLLFQVRHVAAKNSDERFVHIEPPVDTALVTRNGLTSIQLKNRVECDRLNWQLF